MLLTALLSVILVSPQGYYNEDPQYPQSIYMGDMHVPRAQSQIYYNNYLNSGFHQNGAQQWKSRPQGPQFIYASHSSNAGKKITGGKNKSGMHDVNGSTNGEYSLVTVCIFGHN